MHPIVQSVPTASREPASNRAGWDAKKLPSALDRKRGRPPNCQPIRYRTLRHAAPLTHTQERLNRGRDCRALPHNAEACFRCDRESRPGSAAVLSFVQRSPGIVCTAADSCSRRQIFRNRTLLLPRLWQLGGCPRREMLPRFGASWTLRDAHHIHGTRATLTLVA